MKTNGGQFLTSNSALHMHMQPLSHNVCMHSLTQIHAYTPTHACVPTNVQKQAYTHADDDTPIKGEPGKDVSREMGLRKTWTLVKRQTVSPLDIGNRMRKGLMWRWKIIDVLLAASHTQVGPATPTQLTELLPLPACGQILIISYFIDGTDMSQSVLKSTHLVYPIASPS